MQTVVLVLIQVVIVIGLSRLMGLVCRSIKQPLVIGEIIAGIMLGPSLLGLISPEIATTLFPVDTLPFLNVLSQIGLIFFMFLIGLELNPSYLKGQLNTAILISHVSILVPFSLGSILALILYPLLSNNTVNFTAFALFLGSAMSITAFPVLARIITENNLQKTRLGTLALTCAAVDDVTAWCLLAISIAVTRTNSMSGAIPTIIESIIYIVFMLTAVRWLLNKLAFHYQRAGKLNQFVLAGIYMGVVVSALITEFIGIHLIFGAFLLGAALPKHPDLVKEIAEKTEDFVLIFLLPVFFAYSGLRTEIGLLNNPQTWLLCGLVIAVAIIGKYVGTYISARVCQIPKREASALGWMMNTRGLTELIVLNIGLSFNVISPLLFTMLVIMALVTTFMTSPLLEKIYPKTLIRKDIIEGETVEENLYNIQPAYSILVPVANPKSQKALLNVAVAIGGMNNSIVHPLSLVELDEDYLYQSTPEAADQLIKEKQEKLDTLIQSLEPPELRKIVQPIIRVSNNVPQETANIALIEKTDLILVGWHRPAFSDNRLGGRVGKILNTSPVDVAVFVNKKPNNLKSLLVAYAENVHDDLGLSLALRMLVNDSKKHLEILRFFPSSSSEVESSYEFRKMFELLPSEVKTRLQITNLESAEPMQVVIEASQNVDLTIAGTSRTWGIERQTLGLYTDRLAQECQSSLLIARRYSPVNNHLQSLLTYEENTLRS
ncbi:sodium:proton antiporter [Aphanothece hegewaldii CCALA 016]|uniref:Sodium:proton antiporter n=1 Tax=Aphanothece hegewaldii CCALA 016 TaxID=2107694 RepID=A0A2T1M111_9CHRO|nr:cation:proton antiporter [Aphanothece hegewaldii]PSF38354.1 sodium:proton antiporter [Aphanothece hegewaldii CCALA 016]